MRIAILHRGPGWIGGLETYLDTVLPLLVAKGEEVAFFTEKNDSGAAKFVRVPNAVERFCAQTAGTDAALDALTRWKPDVVFSQSLVDPKIEAAALRLAPAIFFAHDYQGTCISGTKCRAFPAPSPCTRRFGPACLVNYFPRRCGGLNPATMLSRYGAEKEKLRRLRRYRMLVTASIHMRTEYHRHGFAVGAVRVLPYGIRATSDVSPRVPGSGAARLLFLGRMQQTKGGGLLLEALPLAAAALGRPIHLVLAGDGPARGEWEAKGRRLAENCRAEFRPWLSSEEITGLLHESELLVLPSVWPEPFGLVGFEAFATGLPAVAFAVGGIPEWLFEGMNGCLAPGNPPTAAGLAAAIARALSDGRLYRELSANALELAARSSWIAHVAALDEVLADVARQK